MKQLLLALCWIAALSGWAETGPFKPEDESLKQYRCPEWFRDVKFGIWAHWGPQCVPEQDSWYARRLYEHDGFDDKKGVPTGQSRANKYHLEHYGHPSKFGFKDIIPLWKAEKWDPERLMALYKKAGAKYFVSLGVHHDNFALYDSKLCRWNAVETGPKCDVVGRWQQAAAKEGLRFGITEHLAASWWFYSASKGADKTGPMAGVPYDGNDPHYADLYWSGNEKPSFRYYGEDVPAAHKIKWGRRIEEIVDRYHPDLLYSDSPLPYPAEAGRQMLAHFYNDNIQQHGGKLEAVYNCKQDANGRWVRDLERGVMEGINPEPWQTDTCIGNWYYTAGYKYKSSAAVIHMLIDIVSKNGNLLLNFPQHADGTLDQEAETILADLAAWMPVNGEAIYATRPWKSYGEGPTKLGKGHFGGLNDTGNYKPSDIRFTQSKDGATLYAFTLGVPQAPVCIKTLAAAAGKVTGVALLGSAAKVEWTQTAEGLVVTLPAEKPCAFAIALKIAGENLQPVVPPTTDTAVTPERDGSFTLDPDTAELHGQKLRVEERHDHKYLAAWDKPADWPSWQIKFPAKAAYEVTITYSAASSDKTAFVMECAGQKLNGAAAKTADWYAYKTLTIGRLDIAAAGKQELALHPADAGKWKALNIRSIKLKKIE